MAPPESERWQFSLRRLMFAMASFAVAFATIGYGYNAPPSPDIGDIRWLVLWMLAPLIGAMIGLGVGILWGRKIQGALIGLGIAVVIDGLIFAVFA